MSSWIGSTRSFAKKKVLENVEYFLVSTDDSTYTIDTLLSSFAAFFYGSKMGNRTFFLDSTNLLLSLFVNNPQCNYLKELPESAFQQNPASLFNSLAIKPKFSDLQRSAAGYFLYEQSMNVLLVQTLEKAGIRSLFDMAIHLRCDLSGTQIPNYVKEVRAYQTRTKKKNLSIYVMAESIDLIKQFGRLGDPSWKLSSMTKAPTNDNRIKLIQTLAEVKILTSQPALILDYNDPVDRFITLMHRGGPNGPEFLKLMSDQEWFLV